MYDVCNAIKCFVYFLIKVVEPTLHRDFMYSSLNAFPRSSFSPVSTPLCREVHKKLGKPRYRVRYYFCKLKIRCIIQTVESANNSNQPFESALLPVQYFLSIGPGKVSTAQLFQSKLCNKTILIENHDNLSQSFLYGPHWAHNPSTVFGLGKQYSFTKVVG